MLQCHLSTSPQVRVGDLDGWPLLPVLPSSSGSTPQLVYMAHRALCVLPPLSVIQQLPKPPAPEDAEALDLEHLGQLPSSWSVVLRALRVAGVPVLDPRFASLASQLCVPHVDVTGAAVTALVQKVRWCAESLGGVTAGPSVTAAGTGAVTADNGGLRADLWGDEECGALLQLLSDNLPASLTREDAALLRALPLFPSLSGGRVALATFQPGGVEEEEEGWEVVGEVGGGGGAGGLGGGSSGTAAACPEEVLAAVPGASVGA